MNETLADPAVVEWMKARWPETAVGFDFYLLPKKFAVTDELYAKLAAEAERTKDDFAPDLFAYGGRLMFRRVPVVVAGPTGDD